MPDNEVRQSEDMSDLLLRRAGCLDVVAGAYRVEHVIGEWLAKQ